MSEDRTEIKLRLHLDLDGIVADATERVGAKMRRLIVKAVERAVDDAVEKEVSRIVRGEIRTALIEADVRGLAHATAKRRLEIALAEMDKMNIPPTLA